MLNRKVWEDEDPVATIVNTIRDYFDFFSDKFINQVHSRVFLKKIMERYFLVYQEYFIWIVVNAFHQDKILPNYRPAHIQLGVDKEKGRKNIKAVLRHSINMRNFLDRDRKHLEAFLDGIAELLSDAAVANFRYMNSYILKGLFDSSFHPNERPPVKGIEVALQHLKKNLKS